MTDLQQIFASIAKAGYLVALTAGNSVSFYWGDDKEKVRQRVAVGRFGLIGANLDTAVFWLATDDFPACYERLCGMSRRQNLHFIEEA